jgi:SNF2 family DNA or RNA helicase
MAWALSNAGIIPSNRLNSKKASMHSLKKHTGEEIYKYCIRDIFQYLRIADGLDEKLEKVGFKESKIWDLLYNFQKDAVVGAIEKIDTFGGCIIADSVVLGKTFKGLAVMKYYQLRNDRILVLAPKRLRENWTIYKQNDKRNILSDEGFIETIY